MRYAIFFKKAQEADNEVIVVEDDLSESTALVLTNRSYQISTYYSNGLGLLPQPLPLETGSKIKQFCLKHYFGVTAI